MYYKKHQRTTNSGTQVKLYKVYLVLSDDVNSYKPINRSGDKNVFKRCCRRVGIICPFLHDIAANLSRSNLLA